MVAALVSHFTGITPLVQYGRDNQFTRADCLFMSCFVQCNYIINYGGYE
nr:MAG TPA: hypothetical protein [Caudoviricetes sp.]